MIFINYNCENKYKHTNNIFYENSINNFYYFLFQYFKNNTLLDQLKQVQNNKINFDKAKNVITIVKVNLPGIILEKKFKNTIHKNTTFFCNKFLRIIDEINPINNLDLFKKKKL